MGYEKEIFQKRLALLTETINHYNSHNRSVSNGTCKYHHEKFVGCAIGRQIEDENLRKDLDRYYSCVSGDAVFSRLPVNLKILGKGFLINIQKLHDNESFWNSSGLTDEGKQFVKEINAKYINNYEQIPSK